MTRKPLLALLVLALAAGKGAAQRATPGQVAYVEGLRAFDGADYGTAAARMRTALAEDAREATARFRYRAQNAEDYFPHLWLGLSLEKLGENDAALRELTESRRQGAVDGRPALRRILDSTLARIAPPTPVPAAAPRPAAEPTPPPTPPALPMPTPPLPSASPAVVAARPAATAVPKASPGRESGVASVRAGLRAFFRGDYAGAERLLVPEAGRNPAARLFLAFSLGGRYLVAEPGDAALLVRARSEYSAALLAGAPADSGPWVSPAILALFGAATSR